MKHPAGIAKREGYFESVHSTKSRGKLGCGVNIAREGSRPKQRHARSSKGTWPTFLFVALHLSSDSRENFG